MKIISNLKQINLAKKQDNLLSKLLILHSRVSTLKQISLLKNKLICFLRFLSPLAGTSQRSWAERRKIFSALA
jgi:hypothetical protein